MKRNFLIGLIICLSALGVKSEKKYPLSVIPEELRRDVKVVVRDYDVQFEIKSISNGVMIVKEVYTILNKSGQEYSKFIKGYNKYMNISNIKGVFYDENGIEFKKLKKADLHDFPAISGYSLYEDTRVMFYNPKVESFPFTVEYSYKIKFNGLFSYPRWLLHMDYDISLENSVFQVLMPSNIDIRTHSLNLSIEPEITNEKGKKTYTWKAKNIVAIPEESYSLPFESVSSCLHIAPVKFKIGGYEGKMETWQGFGKWISDLNRDRNNLPEETKVKIRELVKDASLDKEKIDILYKYLQNKTRYVNVAVGMGGWQTLEAETVDRLSYGDCKALSFYMKSLLETVGIKSYYTLVKAGRNSSNIFTNFPMNQFNHAILCVPSDKDTTWLECTSQIVPTGYIGNFTDNRDVLLIDGVNSRIVRTPRYSLENNITKRIIDFDIDESGGGKAKLNVEYKELASDNMMGRTEYSDDDNKKWLYENLRIKDFVIESVQYELKEEGKVPILYEFLDLELKNHISIVEDQLIIPVNIMNRLESTPVKNSCRLLDIVIEQPYFDIDSITFNIPENYNVSFKPDDVVIRSKYGEYKADFIIADNKLIYQRKFKFFKGIYKENEYNDFREFLKKVNKADNRKLILDKV